MYETFLFLTLLINVHGFDEPDEYLDYQEYVGNHIPQEILEGFQEAIPDVTTKNNNLEDFLQEMQQWLQANLLAKCEDEKSFPLMMTTKGSQTINNKYMCAIDYTVIQFQFQLFIRSFHLYKYKIIEN